MARDRWLPQRNQCEVVAEAANTRDFMPIGEFDSGLPPGCTRALRGEKSLPANGAAKS
jgi:hypothetical protein